ncbi:hypothetical protein BASA81_001620 [Batrachochytrium salamandrivorans]|nr:hypothetical protein BASA81_001620 [Batrachochytrium salamandrivorans]
MRCLLWALAVIVVAVGATDPEAKRKASKFRAEGDAQLVSGNALGSLVHYSDAIKLEPTEDLTLALEHCGKSDEVLLLRSSLLLSQGKCKLAAQDLQLLPPTAATADKLALAMQCAQLVDEADRVLSQGEFQRADELFTQAVDLIKTAAVDIKRRRALARHSRGDYLSVLLMRERL